MHDLISPRAAAGPLAALALLSACGGAGGDSGPQSGAPPTDLAYAQNPVVYTRGVAIAPNTATSAGGTPRSWAVAPSLPPGLSLDAKTGTITGTPTASAANVTCLVTASNAAGSATTSLRITVNPALAWDGPEAAWDHANWQ